MRSESDRIPSDFGTKMSISDRIGKVVSHFISFHSLRTVTPSAKATFHGAVKNFTNKKFKIQYIQ